MQVPYEVRESPGKGKGLFATAFIKKGTLVWKHYEEHNVRYDASAASAKKYRAVLKELEESKGRDAAVAYVEHTYRWPNDGIVVYEFDDGRYTNHSEDENFGVNRQLDPRGDNCYALRDIQAGDELVQNYENGGYLGGPPWFEQVCREYGCALSVADFDKPAKLPSKL